MRQTTSLTTTSVLEDQRRRKFSESTFFAAFPKILEALFLTQFADPTHSQSDFSCQGDSILDQLDIVYHDYKEQQFRKSHDLTGPLGGLLNFN